MPTGAVRDFPPSDRSPSRLIGSELIALAASSLLYPFGIGAIYDAIRLVNKTAGDIADQLLAAGKKPAQTPRARST